MNQFDLEAVIREQCRETVGPLDDRSRPVGKLLAQSDGERLRFMTQAVQIDMNERNPTVIFVNQDECRAGDG